MALCQVAFGVNWEAGEIPDAVAAWEGGKSMIWEPEPHLRRLEWLIAGFYRLFFLLEC